MGGAGVVRPQSVLLDTNAWITDRLLRTAHGSALLYAIKRSGMKLALPEVVEGELAANTIDAANVAIDSINKGFRCIQSIIGSYKAYKLPTEAEISAAIGSRLLQLDPLLVRVPFTIEHAKSALRRVNEQRAPSSMKRQQFKDCAIWEGALSLAKECDIHLVSNDGDFYKDKEKTSLDGTLLRECRDSGVTITPYSSIEQCLQHLFKSVPALDEAKIAQHIHESLANKVADISARYDFKPADLTHFQIHAFLTEDPDVVAVNYSLFLNAVDTGTAPDGTRQDPTVSLFGKCRYNLSHETVQENDLERSECEWRDRAGNTQKRGGFYVTGVIMAGTPTVPYRYETEIPRAGSWGQSLISD